MVDNADKLSYEYRGFEIRLFHNSGRWDYNIPEITTQGYISKLNLYETKEKALKKAKQKIDNYEKRRNNYV